MFLQSMPARRKMTPFISFPSKRSREAHVVSTSIPSAGKMHGLSLSRGFRNGECDVVSNSQLKVDISRRDPIASRCSAQPGFLPLARSLGRSSSPDSTAHPLLRLLAEYKFLQIMRD